MFESSDSLVAPTKTGFLAERVLAIVLLAMLAATMVLVHAP